MSVKITHPFVVPMYVITCSDWETKKQKLLSMVDFNDKECMLKDQFSDYHKYQDNPPYKKSFIELLKDELVLFSQTIQSDINIAGVWCQRYANAEFMGVHNHGALGYSAILYTEFNANHKSTMFYAPYNNFMRGTLIEYMPDVQEGDLLFFPSTIAHTALPNLSDENRTIFSFNVKMP